jgi:hypothetical protein
MKGIAASTSRARRAEVPQECFPQSSNQRLSDGTQMLALLAATPCLGYVPVGRVPAVLSILPHSRVAAASMLEGAPRPVQIIPSVLPADWANMGAECKRLEDAGVDRIQFDVMDGNFVPNLTFGPELIAACRKYTKVMFETQVRRVAHCERVAIPCRWMHECADESSMLRAAILHATRHHPPRWH